MSKGHRYALIAVSAFLVGASLPALAQEGVRATVAQLDAQFDKVWNTLDAQKLAEQFTENAVLLPPTAHAGTGRQAVVAFFGPLFKNKWSGHKLEPVTAQQIGDTMIVAAAHWSANLTDANGKTTPYGGDVAQVFEKVGGEWKVGLASWNLLQNAKQ